MANTDNFQNDDQDDIDLPSNQRLPNDFGTPSEPPEEDDDKNLPIDHQALDTNIDQTELYNEGYAGAAELNSQHVDPDKDEHRIG